MIRRADSAPDLQAAAQPDPAAGVFGDIPVEQPQGELAQARAGVSYAKRFQEQVAEQDAKRLLQEEQAGPAAPARAPVVTSWGFYNMGTVVAVLAIVVANYIKDMAPECVETDRGTMCPAERDLYHTALPAAMLFLILQQLIGLTLTCCGCCKR